MTSTFDFDSKIIRTIEFILKHNAESGIAHLSNTNLFSKLLMVAISFFTYLWP